MTPAIPANWRSIIGARTEQPCYQKLLAFVAEDRAAKCSEIHWQIPNL